MKEGEGRRRGKAEEVLRVYRVCERVRKQERIRQPHHGEAHLHLWRVSEDLPCQGRKRRTHEEGPQRFDSQDDRTGEVTGKEVARKGVQRREGQMSQGEMGKDVVKVRDQEAAVGS